MRRITIVGGLIVALFVQGTMLSQFKSQTADKPKVSESIVRQDGSGLFLGLFNPANFSMRHSYSFSYMLMSGRNIGVGMYTNSMFYTVSDPLNLRVDISAMHSPFGSYSKQMDKNFNRIFIDRVELNYRPSDKMFFQLQFRQAPYNPYWGLYSPYYYNPFYPGYDFYR